MKIGDRDIDLPLSQTNLLGMEFSLKIKLEIEKFTLKIFTGDGKRLIFLTGDGKIGKLGSGD